MCKPKNRVMCPDCKRLKILFKSESNANTFIKFNKDNLEYGGDKLRAYWCPACCGWHVSHHKYHKEMDKQTDKLIEAYNTLKDIRRVPNIDNIIDEVYQTLVIANLKDRKQINELLRHKEYSHYSQFVKQEAKVKYYIENKL